MSLLNIEFSSGAVVEAVYMKSPMYKMATVGGGGGWRIFLGIFIRLYRVADRLWQVGSEAVCCPTSS